MIKSYQNADAALKFEEFKDISSKGRLPVWQESGLGKSWTVLEDPREWTMPSVEDMRLVCEQNITAQMWSPQQKDEIDFWCMLYGCIKELWDEYFVKCLQDPAEHRRCIAKGEGFLALAAVDEAQKKIPPGVSRPRRENRIENSERNLSVPRPSCQQS